MVTTIESIVFLVMVIIGAFVVSIYDYESNVKYHNRISRFHIDNFCPLCFVKMFLLAILTGATTLVIEVYSNRLDDVTPNIVPVAIYTCIMTLVWIKILNCIAHISYDPKIHPTPRVTYAIMISIVSLLVVLTVLISPYEWFFALIPPTAGAVRVVFKWYPSCACNQF